MKSVFRGKGLINTIMVRFPANISIRWWYHRPGTKLPDQIAVAVLEQLPRAAPSNSAGAPR